MIGRTKKRKAYNTQLQDSVAARVNSDCADWEKSNANEFTHGTHDRNLNPATPAAVFPSNPFLAVAIGIAATLFGFKLNEWMDDFINEHFPFHDPYRDIGRRGPNLNPW